MMKVKSRENSEIHVVESNLEELERKIRRHRIKIWKRIGVCVLCVAVILTGVYYFFRYQTYSRAYVTGTYQNKNTDNSRYIEFVDNIFQYSKDGAALLNKKGEEIWNQPFQMQNPIVEICRGTLAIGDKGGTSIFVLQKDGMKGEIRTPTPIEKMTVSEQGIVGAVLKEEDTPKVVCYDLKGNILAEHKASFKNTGYPVDLAISNDGKMLLVSYVCLKEVLLQRRLFIMILVSQEKKKKTIRQHWQSIRIQLCRQFSLRIIKHLLL